MEQSINLISILATNFVSILMMLMILGNKSWKINRRVVESRLLAGMIVIVVIMCFTDAIVSFYDGRTGRLVHMGVYVGNMLLFLGVVADGVVWLLLVTHYVRRNFPKKQLWFAGITSVIAVVLMIANAFYPFVFYIDAANVYHRRPFWVIYTAADYLMLLDAMIVYYSMKKKGGELKVFPMYQFIIPVIVGTIIQSTFYGVSMIWPSIAISTCGVVLGLKNEAMFSDGLTGVYNRSYLVQVKLRSRRGRATHTLMLIDVIGLHRINREYGHVQGDRILKDVAKLLSESVEEMGIVIRFSGDTFMLLINTTDSNEVNNIISAIDQNIDKYNSTISNGCRLEVAKGVETFDIAEKTADEMLSILNGKVEENKRRIVEAGEITEDNKGDSEDEF